MKGRTCALNLALGLFLLTASAEAAVFHPQSFTLANGMRVVIVHNGLSDAVVQMVWYRAGGADDAPGASGTAHYLEHLMFKGTTKVPDGAFSRLIAARGGQDNAFTTADSTAYYVTVPRRDLAMAMQMEADRMRGLVIEEKAAATELDVVRSERQERIDNKPRGIFQEKIRSALFGAHPYGRPVIGWAADLQRVTPADARTFYERYYAPDNAILVLSGAVEAADALALADATFGRLQPGGARQEMALPSPAQSEPAVVEMRDARIKQPLWVLRILAPSQNQSAQRAAALEVLAETLGGGEVGRLYRRFVMEAKTASAIDASYDSVQRGPAVFGFAATPVDVGSSAKLAQEVEAALREWAQSGIAAGEVEAAKKRLQDSAIFARDRLMVPAQVLGEALASGGTIADVEDWPARIARVKREEVNEALRLLVRSRARVSGFLLPEEVEQ